MYDRSVYSVSLSESGIMTFAEVTCCLCMSAQTVSLAPEQFDSSMCPPDCLQLYQYVSNECFALSAVRQGAW